MATSRVLGRKFAFVVAVVSAMLFVMIVGMAQDTHAAVGPGAESSGGGGACPKPPKGGINGCPYTTNGQGWYEIPVDASDAPMGNGTSYWLPAKKACSEEGASHVMAYVVLTGEKTLSKAWIYAYVTGWEEDVPYTGNTSIETAKARFKTLPLDERGKYTFGQDLGWFCYNKERPWTINGQSYVRVNGGARTQGRNAATVLPGTRLTFDHDLRNNGPFDMDRNVTINVHRDNYSLATGEGVASAVNPSGATARGTANELFYKAYGLDRTVTQNDVGNKLCQHIAWARGSWNDTNPQGSVEACANVPYRYALSPAITGLSNGAVVESNDTPLEVPGQITNEGPTRSRPNVKWNITQIEYAPSVAIAAIPNRDGGSNVSRDPCDYYVSPLRTACATLETGTIANGVNYPGNVSVKASTDLANKPAGTKICFALSVQPYSHDGDAWRHSRLVCFVIGKKPKTQVLSGDLIVGRTSATNQGGIADVVTSVSTNGNRYYGSWAEYSILPSGCVKGMASGSGLAGGAPSQLLSGLSLLTFTNPSRDIAGQSGCAGGIGRYEHTSVSPNISARFPIQVLADAAAPGVPAKPDSLPSRTVDFNSATPELKGHYQAPAGTTALTIDGGAIGRGRWVVISAPNATVTIAGNITYTTDPLRDLADIPQVIIIARDIIVEDDVEQIDAWLVAVGVDEKNSAGAITQRRGTINTCGGGSDGITQSSDLTIETCGRRLTVNGPVMANHLLLRRTAGSGTGAAIGDPAEVFNLRADAYLWASAFAADAGRVTTVETKELPPRF